jgi:hypothetical protein
MYPKKRMVVLPITQPPPDSHYSLFPTPYSLLFLRWLLRVLFFLFHSVAAQKTGQAL